MLTNNVMWQDIAGGGGKKKEESEIDGKITTSYMVK